MRTRSWIHVLMLVSALFASACGGGSNPFEIQFSCGSACPSAIYFDQDARDTSVLEGQSAAFSVVVVSRNDNLVSGRWERCDPVPDAAACVWRDPGGATARFTYDLGPVTLADNGARYRAQVYAQDGQHITSRTALLSVNPIAGPPIVATQPSDVSIAVGGTARFAVVATGSGLSYQWQISRDDGTSYSDINAMTEASLTLDAVTLQDDRALLRVRISNGNGNVLSNAARLTVSTSTEPVRFSDEAFAAGDWSMTLVFNGNGGTAVVQQSVSGGNPGSFRRIRHVMNAAPSATTLSSVFSFHFKAGAVYDPGTMGPLVAIDYTQDALLITGGGQGQATTVALRQDGKIFYAQAKAELTPDFVWTHKGQSGLVATDFFRVTPDLTTSFDRPDFSIAGKQIEFGFMRGNSTGTGSGGSTVEGGIDNWAVVVHRAP